MAQNLETRQFALEQVDRLLGQLAFQISRILRPHDPISVHHLRVAVRRFSRALLVFGPCFPAHAGKKKTLPETAQEAAAELLPDLAQEFFDRGKQAVDAEGSAAELHQFRVAAKKFRYTIELFAPLYGPALGAWLERIRSIQALAG